MLAQGCSVGWVSPSLLILQSEKTPIYGGPININEASWIGSIVYSITIAKRHK